MKKSIYTIILVFIDKLSIFCNPRNCNNIQNCVWGKTSSTRPD